MTIELERDSLQARSFTGHVLRAQRISWKEQKTGARGNNLTTPCTPIRLKRETWGRVGYLTGEFIQTRWSGFTLFNFHLFVAQSTVAIKNYGDKMSTFEQSEILDFPDVWFLGLEAKKIEGVPGASQNSGELK